jgi:hypothetical protein
VLDGEIKFEIEKPDRSFEVINATRGSYVFVPERLLHSLEVVGSTPAIRYEVTSGPSSTPVYEKRPSQPAKGVEYIPVTLSNGLNPLDVYNEGNGGKPWPHHVNVYELEKAERDEEELHAGSDARQPRARQFHLRLPPRDVPDRVGRSRAPAHRYGRVMDRDARRAAMGVRRG